jgi:hypothetical protein
MPMVCGRALGGTNESAANRNDCPAAAGKPNMRDAIHSAVKDRVSHATAARAEAATPTALVARYTFSLPRSACK